jgi:23S rRNA (uracil1939-C5)-methyltransferase
MSRRNTVVEVAIERLGARGDGIARLGGELLYVAGALAGERVAVRPGPNRGDGREAALVEVLTPAPERQAAPCPHFGTCGGCAVQHLAAPACAAWKRGLVVEALARRGLAGVEVTPAAGAPAGTRRRARFALRRVAGGLVPAFRAARSHELVALDLCPVLEPAVLEGARRIAAALEPKGASELEATAARTGLDLVVTASRAPGLEEMERLAQAGETCDVARIAWAESGRPPYAIVQRRTSLLRFGAVEVELPPGAFVQPTAWGEAQIAARVGAIVPSGARAADLFAGCGALGFRLAPGRRIEAFEADPAMVDAGRRAAMAAGLGASWRGHARDLDAAPLRAGDLARFDAVVLDPPRAGARAQAEALAASSVPAIAYVSCHPASFARDARILVDGGYALEAVWPLDQFPWSHHLELVARFARR